MEFFNRLPGRLAFRVVSKKGRLMAAFLYMDVLVPRSLTMGGSGVIESVNIGTL
jgi:hypothetical protein